MGESLIKACKVMGMRRIGLVVAGEKASADILAAHLEQQGLVVVKRIAMGLSDEEAMAQASVAEITAACQAVSGDGVDGVVIGSRTITTCGKGLLPRIESSLCKPVVSAMQAFIWDLMRLALGEDKPLGKREGHGRLFADPGSGGREDTNGETAEA